jgi:hypothetical protein
MESCRKIFNEPVDINLTNEIIVPDRKEPTLVGVGIQRVYIQGESPLLFTPPLSPAILS